MDLNQLYFDHQVLLIHAQIEPCAERRRLHRDGAALVAGRIGCMQVAMGARAAPGWAAAAARNSDCTGRPPVQLFGPARGPHDWRSAARGAAG